MKFPELNLRILVVLALILGLGRSLPVSADNGTGPDAFTMDDILATDPNASSDMEEPLFWEDSRRGWFFYEIDEDSDEELWDEREPEFQIDWNAFKSLRADQMNTAIEELKNIAVTYPSKQNLHNYMEAQNIAVQKADTFMYAWQRVLREDPRLDATVRRPASGYATNQLSVAKSQSMETAFEYLAADEGIGMVLFYEPGNYYSDLQLPLFEELVDKRKWNPVSYVNIKESPGIAQKFEVKVVPEIWMVLHESGAEDEKIRVTAGLRTQDVIIEEAVRAYEDLTGVKLIKEPFKYLASEKDSSP